MLRNRNFFIFIMIILFLIVAFNVSQKIINNNPNIDKEIKSYINSLYISDERIYNNYLTTSEKQMYDFFIKNIKEGKTTITNDLLTFGCTNYQDCFSKFKKANSSIIIDHPELLSYAGYTSKYENNNMRLHIRYSTKLPLADEFAEMIINLKLKKIKKETKNLSDKEKIKYVYNYIGKNTKYDTLMTYDNKNQTIYNVFLKGNAVCAGFAKASQVIFQYIGINSYSVEGYTKGAHMWNIVEVDGKYYYFDSTVASCIKESANEYYDGLRQNKFNKYSMNYPDWYPTIEKTNLFSESELAK